MNVPAVLVVVTRLSAVTTICTFAIGVPDESLTTPVTGGVSSTKRGAVAPEASVNPNSPAPSRTNVRVANDRRPKNECMTSSENEVTAEPLLRFAITLNGRNPSSRAISNEWLGVPNELSNGCRGVTGRITRQRRMTGHVAGPASHCAGVALSWVVEVRWR
jgi:hypothetical protein